MPKEKAPDLDGFIIGFYLKHWSLIKPDLVVVFNNLFNLDGNAFHELNVALLVLLPKRRLHRIILGLLA